MVVAFSFYFRGTGLGCGAKIPYHALLGAKDRMNWRLEGNKTGHGRVFGGEYGNHEIAQEHNAALKL